MQRPFFSFIIPTLNEEKFLPRLLASLAAQTVRDFEVIVVDGASRDATIRVARTFAGKLPALAVLKSKKRGQSLQRNLGAARARGRYCVFVDADSAVLPYAVERMAAFISKPKALFFTAWTRPDGEEGGDALATLIGNLYIEGAIMVKRAVAPGAFMVVEKALFERVGGFNETQAFGEDFDITQRINAMGIRLEVLRETLYVYSLRRVRREGKLTFLRLYAKPMILGFLTRQGFKKIPNYVMGGQVYSKEKKRTVGRLAILRYERILKKIMRELLY
jgi:glycosyltransferase involved in cell wall biosynthesis